MILDKVNEKYISMSDHLLDEDIEMLYKHSKGYAIDLGVFFGVSTAIMSLKAESVSGVGLFEMIESLTANESEKNHYRELFEKEPHCFQQIKFALSEFKNISLFQLRTESFYIPCQEKIDSIFFDASHGYLGLQKEYNNFKNSFKRDTNIMFHDYNSDWGDVQKFVDDRIKYKELKQIDLGGSVIVTQLV